MEFDFNKNQVVDSIEKVPQDFRGLYVENDEGKFKLDTSDDFKKSTVSVVTGLNRSLNAARLETKAAKEGKIDLSSLSDYGTTVDEILDGVNDRIAEVRKAGKGKGSEDVEKAVKSAQDAMAKAHVTQLTAVAEENKALTGQLYGQMVINEAESALNAAGAVNSKLLMPFIKEKVGVSKEDGNFKIYVKNETGDVRYSGTTGDPMSIKELVAEFKGDEAYGPMFKSETPSGGGKKPSITTIVKKGDEKLTPNQKIELGLKERQAAAGR